MIAVADKHPNVYIDTSAYAAHRYPAELVEYLKGRGSRKVLFGSNYPMLTPARALGPSGRTRPRRRAAGVVPGRERAPAYSACESGIGCLASRSHTQEWGHSSLDSPWPRYMRTDPS